MMGSFGNIGQRRAYLINKRASSDAMYLASNKFNVKISGLVDNEIHHLTLVPGMRETRARKGKKFSYFQNEVVRTSILAFMLPAASNAKLKKLN